MSRHPNLITKALRACLLSLLLLLASNASAEVLHIEDFGQRISDRSTTTYLDLLRLIFTDLSADDGKAGSSVRIRTLYAEDEPQAYVGEMQVKAVDGAWVRANGERALLLFINVTSDAQLGFPWGELNVFALYEVGKQPRLLDAVDVSGDRFTTFLGDLHLHPNDDAVLVRYQHFNAGETFTAFALLHVGRGKVQSLFDGLPSLYYGRVCRAEIAETGDIDTSQSRHNGYRDIVFDIKQVGTKFHADCDTPGRKSTQNFRLSIGWQRGAYRYLDGGAELKRLERGRKRLGFGD